MLERILILLRRKLEGFFGYIVVFLVLSLFFSLAQNLARISKVERGIQEAQEKVDRLRKENEELETEIEIVKGDEFVEKQIRDKLGLAKEGETIIILPDDEILRKFAPKYLEEAEVLPDPNWLKWWKLFF